MPKNTWDNRKKLAEASVATFTEEQKHIAAVNSIMEPSVMRELPMVFGEVEVKTLTDLFRSQVLEKAELAWYVDYFTENPEHFNLKFFSEDPLVRWTHEDMAGRDDDFKWGAEDVSTWFTHMQRDGSTKDYEHIVKFHSAGVKHCLRIAKFNVTLDGADRWAEYVDLGVRGALGSLVETFEHLDSFEIRVDSRATIAIPTLTASVTTKR